MVARFGLLASLGVPWCPQCGLGLGGGLLGSGLVLGLVAPRGQGPLFLKKEWQLQEVLLQGRKGLQTEQWLDQVCALALKAICIVRAMIPSLYCFLYCQGYDPFFGPFGFGPWWSPFVWYLG